jgi:hypothetical protein
MILHDSCLFSQMMQKIPGIFAKMSFIFLSTNDAKKKEKLFFFCPKDMSCVINLQPLLAAAVSPKLWEEPMFGRRLKMAWSGIPAVKSSAGHNRKHGAPTQ